VPHPTPCASARGRGGIFTSNTGKKRRDGGMIIVEYPFRLLKSTANVFYVLNAI
jgi:hypothetical protein